MTSSSIWYSFPAKCFFMFGEQKIVRWCRIRRIWRMINQFKSHQSCTQQPLQLTIDLCAGALSCWNRTPFVSFSGHFEMSQVLLFKVLNYLSSLGFIWKETMQLVSGDKEVEFNACQVSLLWHNSFIVSLWTFQPTLVHWSITLFYVYFNKHWLTWVNIGKLLCSM